MAAAALVGGGLLISLWLSPEGIERYAESLPIARAILEEPHHVWPPAARARPRDTAEATDDSPTPIILKFRHGEGVASGPSS